MNLEYIQINTIKMDVCEEKVILTQVLEIGDIYGQYTRLLVQPGYIL